MSGGSGVSGLTTSISTQKLSPLNVFHILDSCTVHVTLQAIVYLLYSMYQTNIRQIIINKYPSK